MHWFSLNSSFSTDSDSKQGRRSADDADWNSKICVIGEICGSLSFTTNDTDSTDKTGHWPRLDQSHPRKSVDWLFSDSAQQKEPHPD